MKILVSLSTRGRYENYLAMAISAIAMQTRKPDHLTIYDDTPEPKDIREVEAYLYLLEMLNEKGISWNVVYGYKKGQHYNDDMANRTQGFDAVWRVDDDTVPEPDVLEKLEAQLVEGVGAVGGSILTPPLWDSIDRSSSINNLYLQNLQWFKIDKTQEVDHLHCSFLYRAGIADWDLRLSPKSFRGETMFTYAIKLKGYKILVTPCITWHFKSKQGGTRATDNAQNDYAHDQAIFDKWMNINDKPIIIADNGLGDHIVLRKILDDFNIKDITIACCYPEVFEGFNIISIAEARNRGYNLDEYSLYYWMEKHNWKGNLYDAYLKLYANIIATTI